MNSVKQNYKKYFLIIGLLFLVGCSNTDSEEYSSAIQKGLDTLGVENYEKAAAYFELALEEKPEDEKATAYLEQTQLYNEAENAFDSNDVETAKSKAESVSNITEGSESLVIKSNEILNEIKKRETYKVDFKKKHNEIIDLIDAGKLDEAQEKTNAALNDDEINKNYISDIKVSFEKLQDEIEVKKDEIQKEDESEEVEEVAESSNNTIEAYNELVLPLKVLLAATTVDERALTPELLGYYVYYNFVEDVLLVNVTSGAGVGHPWYVIQYDTETITPVQGVVYTGGEEYLDASVDPTNISKIDLYNRYMESKDSYDLALQNVVEFPEMTMLQYEEWRSMINQ